MVRVSSFIKICLVLGAFVMTAYTIYDYFGSKGETPTSEQIRDKMNDVVGIIKIEADPKLEQSNRAHSRGPNLPLTNMTADKVCEMKKNCKLEEIAFQVVSGAANVIGPSICVNNVWLLSNALGNIGRGMNVAVVDGKTGKMTKTKTFDLYDKDSQEFKNFLNNLEDNEVVLMATFDDATRKLEKDARVVLTDLGSSEATKITFRDNWIFVGGKNLRKYDKFEKYKQSQKDINKFGDWPSTIMLEDCIPRL